jgi:hypothetical protein
LVLILGGCAAGAGGYLAYQGGLLSADMVLDPNAFDIRTYRVGQPGQYQIDFGTSSGAADLGSCSLSVHSGDHYQFVTLPERIVINRVDDPVSVGTDLIVSTSTLCR